VQISKDEILVRELAKLSDKAAELGGKLGGPAAEGLESAAKLGGSLGVKLVARRLPTECSQKELKLRSDAKTALSAVYDYLTDHGRMIEDDDAQGDASFPRLSAVIGSGFFRLNPTIVHVEITHAGPASCTVQLSAAAKEGLIKQRSAEKAVDRLAAVLKPLAAPQ
jgi:hypothetical protein